MRELVWYIVQFDIHILKNLPYFRCELQCASLLQGTASWYCKRGGYTPIHGALSFLVHFSFVCSWECGLYARKYGIYVNSISTFPYAAACTRRVLEASSPPWPLCRPCSLIAPSMLLGMLYTVAKSDLFSPRLAVLIIASCAKGSRFFHFTAPIALTKGAENRGEANGACAQSANRCDSEESWAKACDGEC